MKTFHLEVPILLRASLRIGKLVNRPIGQLENRPVDGRGAVRGFTLIELLAVIAIIGILAGMIGSASYAARQSSYRAQAEAEAREIANACRTYWMASGSWQGGSSWPGGSGPISKGGTIYKAFTGVNPSKTVFLEFDEQRFEGDGGDYLDPWGNPYEVTFDKEHVVTRTQKFSSSVTFPMRYRYEYYGKLFNSSGSSNSDAEFDD